MEFKSVKSLSEIYHERENLRILNRFHLWELWRDETDNSGIYQHQVRKLNHRDRMFLKIFHPEKFKQYDLWRGKWLRWRQMKREGYQKRQIRLNKLKQYAHKQTKELGNYYIKSLINQSLGIPFGEIQEELISFYRTFAIFKRLIKERQKNAKN